MLCFSAVLVAGRRTGRGAVATLSQQQRTFFGKDFVPEPDTKIATDAERKSKTGGLPEDLPEGLKKDMEALGITAADDLDHLEEEEVQGFQESGMVPPEDAGTFKSPILIPSRLDERQVGYTCPITHAVFWFNIQNDNSTYYIKDLGLFFKMVHIEGGLEG